MIQNLRKRKKNDLVFIITWMQRSSQRKEQKEETRTRKVTMSTVETITETTKGECLEKSSQQEGSGIQQSGFIQPFALSLVEIADSLKSLNESKEQISELITSLSKEKSPKNNELLIRGTKELRELLKVKLEYGKFAHVAGIRPGGKEQKETA